MSGMPLDFQIDGFQALLLKGKLRYRIFNQISEKNDGFENPFLSFDDFYRTFRTQVNGTPVNDPA